jgi:hypothetical protein
MYRSNGFVFFLTCGTITRAHAWKYLTTIDDLTGDCSFRSSKNLSFFATCARKFGVEDGLNLTETSDRRGTPS